VNFSARSAPSDYTPFPPPTASLVKTFQTPCTTAFDIEVDANPCFPELLLNVVTVDVSCTLAIRGGDEVYTLPASVTCRTIG
jgi:hypothetical protein